MKVARPTTGIKGLALARHPMGWLISETSGRRGTHGVHGPTITKCRDQGNDNEAAIAAAADRAAVGLRKCVVEAHDDDGQWTTIPGSLVGNFASLDKMSSGVWRIHRIRKYVVKSGSNEPHIKRGDARTTAGLTGGPTKKMGWR